VGVVETPHGFRHEATLGAHEKAAILRRHGALKASGGRSNIDSIAQIAKDHSVARNFLAELHKTILVRASTSPMKRPGRPEVYDAEFEGSFRARLRGPAASKNFHQAN